MVLTEAGFGNGELFAELVGIWLVFHQPCQSPNGLRIVCPFHREIRECFPGFGTVGVVFQSLFEGLLCSFSVVCDSSAVAYADPAFGGVLQRWASQLEIV